MAVNIRRIRRLATLLSLLIVSLVATNAVTTATAQSVTRLPIRPTTSSTPPQRSASVIYSDTCAALQADLPRLAGLGVTTAACTMTGGAPVLPALPSVTVPASIQPAPSWCGTDGFMYFTRTESCGVFRGQVNVTDVRTGALVGQISYNFITYSYTSTSIQTWAHQLQIQETSQWGLGAGSTVDGSATCSGACTVASSSFPSQPVTPGAFDNGEAYFNTTATAPGAVGSSMTTWTYTFHNAGWTGSGGSSNPISTTQPTVRCDNALPGSSTIGCVFPDYITAVVYSRSGPYAALAQHIGDAQGSGLPGAYPSGAPLTRLTDPVLQDQNRQTACPSSYPRPPTKSCDEYPFASSHQGAAFSGGGPRTFYYCVIVLVSQSTGPNGYSVCMIDATQNSGGGSILGQFYNSNRILENDAYRVWIVA